MTFGDDEVAERLYIRAISILTDVPNELLWSGSNPYISYSDCMTDSGRRGESSRKEAHLAKERPWSIELILLGKGEISDLMLGHLVSSCWSIQFNELEIGRRTLIGSSRDRAECLQYNLNLD